MRSIIRNRNYFGVTKYLYDSLYLNDPNYEGYNIASSSIHTQPTKIKTTLANPV